jgi:hypothetical protein
MEEKIKEIINRVGTDVSGKWMSMDQAKKFAEIMVEECLVAIDKTNTSHVYTTFDQGMVMGTIQKSKKSVKEHFGVN